MKSEKIREKFAGLRKSAVGRVMRRADFKGPRTRLNLRVARDIEHGLKVLKAASGVETNAFCVNVLAKAVEQEVAKLRKDYDAADWEAVTRIAERL